MDKEEVGREQTGTPVDAQMAAWMKYASPGKPHGFLQRMEGRWKATGKFWLHPGAEPTEAEGTFDNEMILGGRFLLSRYAGEMMDSPFEGLALDGFDNQKQRCVGLWIDSMGTLMMTFEGDLEEEGRVRTMVTEYTDPMTGQPTRMKGVTTLVSDDEYRYEGWNTGPDGEYFLGMEIVATRVA